MNHPAGIVVRSRFRIAYPKIPATPMPARTNDDGSGTGVKCDVMSVANTGATRS